MSASGSHQIAWQKGNRPIYANVAVKVEYDIHTKEPLWGLEKVPESWQGGVLFGFALLRETAAYFDFHRIRVTIASLDGRPGETTISAVAFVVFHAVAKALGLNVEQAFMFDDVTGRFVISPGSGG